MTDDLDVESATGAVGDTTPSDDTALLLRGLTKTFRSGLFGRGRRLRALDNLDLTVPRGTVHALLGPNGAGKTTTVRAIATLMRPDEGSIHVDGIDALAHPDEVRQIIGVSGQYAAVDGNLTGFENLRLVAQLYGLSRADASSAARAMIDELLLSDAADRPMHTYSGGMRRRLDLAGALINRPSLIILDEPTTGLDPRGRRQMWEVIGEQVEGGTTVLLTTQYLEEADALADQVTVIDGGRIRAQGSASELKSTTAQSILTVELAADPDAVTRPRLSTTLADIGLGLPQEITARRWSVPVGEGTRSAVSAVKALEQIGVDVDDAHVAAPTLDDVFLQLTGESPADVESATESTREEFADVR